MLCTLMPLEGNKLVALFIEQPDAAMVQRCAFLAKLDQPTGPAEDGISIFALDLDARGQMSRVERQPGRRAAKAAVR